MSEMGIYVNPKDGGKMVEITASTMPMSFIRKITVDPWSGDRYNPSKSFNIPGLSNYDVIVVPMTTANFWAYGQVQKTLIDSWSISGNNFNCRYGQFSTQGGWLPGNNGETYFMLYGTLKETAKESFGIFINDSSAAVDNFRGITQDSDLAFCVFRQKIRLTNRQKWAIPSNIPNRGSACVFMRPVSSSHVLRYNRASNEVWSWGEGDVYIVIFSYGLNLQPSDGLTIWNPAGKVVYSSDYMPFVKNGHSRTLSRNSASSSFATPMFTFDTPSAWVTEESINYNVYAGGYRVSGNSIIGARLWTLGSYPKYDGSSINVYDENTIFGSVYCVDFNDYF